MKRTTELRKTVAAKLQQCVVIAIVLITLGACGEKSEKSTIRIKGSDTMLPLSQKAAEKFMTVDSSITITVTGGGSGVGIAALLEGTTDLAQSSRKIKFDEEQKLEDAGKHAVEAIVAYDALAIVTHPSNIVNRLTREQLEGIFTGTITNWKELGGDDLVIVPYARETSSGTYEFFKESVLANKNYVNGIMSMPATGAIIQSVSQTKGAIAYVGLAYVAPSVQAVEVSYDSGATFVAPSVENAKNQSYPIVRPLFYYYEQGAAETVKPFIDYMFSEAGQKLVAELGYITVK
ncbi:MAG: PstS family phosphate ABC transporter substrate-binding protein [Bacteroidales bacterium]|jgi:phosphate transport system substrate-binding protein|nr:PstS family phosphate ABC transporter substrate-binding protein [Bacteroidales bacterium]